MKRREFIKRGALFVPTIFIPHLIRAGTMLTARGLVEKTQKHASGGGGGGSQYTLINHASGSFGTGEASAGPIDTTGANLFVAAGSYFDGSPSGPTDTGSNTWTPLSTFSDGSGNYHQQMFYVISPTTNPTHFFNFTAAFLLIQVAAFAVSGRTPIFDIATGYNHPNGESDTSFQPGSVTPAGDNELIVTGATWDNSVTGSINSAFNIIEQHQEGSDSIFAALAWKAQTTGSAENPTLSFTGAITAAAASIAAFK